jgi:hypothetical protein
MSFPSCKKGLKIHLAEEALNRMNVEGLINVCQAVTHGNLRHVRNLKTNSQGTVINAEGNELTVQVGQTTEVWSYEDCEEHNTD